MTSLRPVDLSVKKPRLSESALDSILAWQCLVAWAGEGTDELQRLGWWRTDLTDKIGGGDFFKRLLPSTWEWASFEAVREAAIRHDQTIRQQLAQPDLVNTLFFWGFTTDERLADRLADHKRSQEPLHQRLNFPLEMDEFNGEAFKAVLESAGASVKYEVVSNGREIQSETLPSAELRSRNLAAALLPLTDSYSMPFYRLDPSDAL